MTRSAFDKIATGLNDAIAVARGDADPARTIVYTFRPCPTCDERMAERRVAGGDDRPAIVVRTCVNCGVEVEHVVSLCGASA